MKSQQRTGPLDAYVWMQSFDSSVYKLSDYDQNHPSRKTESQEEAASVLVDGAKRRHVIPSLGQLLSVFIPNPHEVPSSVFVQQTLFTSVSYLPFRATTPSQSALSLPSFRLWAPIVEVA